ncbi:MAG: methyl-accepting chemotaxis protein [Clostridiaceae bacterium]|nr:methyl-accepting chemotaxis protein [Clostridiaceae bacterium]
MKSLKQKLILLVGLLIVTVCLCLSITTYFSAYKALLTNTENTIQEVSNEVSNAASTNMRGELKELEAIAARSEVISRDISKEDKIKFLYDEAQRIGCESLTIIDINGDSFNGDGKEQNLADREYFKKALAGESNFSDPMIGKSTGQFSVFLAVPIKEDGKVIGVMSEVRDGNGLSALTNNVKYGKDGFAYILNNEGTVIAHNDKDLVMNGDNIIKKAETNEKFKDKASAFEKAINEKNGFSTYKLENEEKFIGYTEVEGTNWVAVVEVSSVSALSGLRTLRILIVFTSLLLIAIGVVLAYIMSTRIAKGIKDSSDSLETLAGGDLRIKLNNKYLNRNDEIGQMAKGMQFMSNSLSKIIKGIKNNSETIDVEAENLSSASSEISMVSQNITESINEIAKGTTSQSEELMKISEIVNDFGEKVVQVIKEIQDVDKTSNDINEQAKNSSGEMELLNASVVNVGNVFKAFSEKIDGLGKNVNEINEITNVINGIAEQTNLLALNAAIEAARAGEAGKGFSVVAEEIRKLAEESQLSAEKINQLIARISKEANKIVEESSEVDNELSNQEGVIKESIESFNKIIEAIDVVLPKINTVETSINKLNEEKNEILVKVDNISSVALEVSASSEEISASSEEMNASIEEMSAIAQTLKEKTNEMIGEVNRFKVN